MKEAYQLISKQTILQEVFLIILGLALLFNPTTVFDLSVIIICIYLLINGGLLLYAAFQDKKDGQDDYRNFVFGIINFILTLFLYFSAGKLMLFLPILMGLFILYNAIVNLMQGVQIQKYSSNKAGAYILYSTVILIVGLVLIFYPFKITILLFRLIGVILLVMGIVSAIWMVIFTKQEDKE